jgi:hypothetical protein
MRVTSPQQLNEENHMEPESHVDPWIIYLGIIVLLVVASIAVPVAVYSYFVHQVDHRIEECPTTKTRIAVKDCKGASS